MKKTLAFPPSLRLRQFPHFSYLLSALLMTMTVLACFAAAQAQGTQTAPVAKEKFDAGVGGFYQVTNQTNGNFIIEDTTESGGVLLSFRRPYRPWLGYEANFGYTKFYEAYNKDVVKVQNNVTDLSFSYLLQSPTFYGLQAFLTLGPGIIIFSPVEGTITSNAGLAPSHLSSQLLPEFAYSLGLNYPLFGHFGVRGGLRGLLYKTPDFHQESLDAHRLRTTLEPTFSIYYRF